MALSLQEQMQLIKRLDEENKLVGAKGIGEDLFNTLCIAHQRARGITVNEAE